MPEHKLCVPCLFGLEGPLGNELRHMGLRSVMPENGRVRCTGTDADIARINLRCRFGERVLLELGSFPAPTFDALFEGVKALPWAQYLPADAAFPVKGYSLESALHSVPDCQKIIKKAVVESLKQCYHVTWFAETGALYQIQFSLVHDTATLYLDTTGTPLHKRGYRPAHVAAPLRETLAAALVDIAGYRGRGDFCDPFCGSGTIAIEAALAAKGRYRELEKFITHLEGGHLEIDSEQDLVVNIDGEALWSKHVNFDLIPGGVNFLVPANMAFFHPETTGGHETREFVHA